MSVMLLGSSEWVAAEGRRSDFRAAEIRAREQEGRGDPRADAGRRRGGETCRIIQTLLFSTPPRCKPAFCACFPEFVWVGLQMLRPPSLECFSLPFFFFWLRGMEVTRLQVQEKTRSVYIWLNPVDSQAD